jgi:hypothetical protein
MFVNGNPAIHVDACIVLYTRVPFASCSKNTVSN